MSKKEYKEPRIKMLVIDNEGLLAGTAITGGDGDNPGGDAEAKHYQFIEDDDEPTSGLRSPWDN